MVSNSKSLLFLMLLAAVVFVSGCTGGTTSGATGPGVVILDFEPDFSSVESGDNVMLSLRIQNQGGEEAGNVLARISGIDPTEWRGLDEEERLGDLQPPNPQFGTVGAIRQHVFEMEAPQLPEGITQTYRPNLRVYYEYITTAVKPITIVNENELRRLIREGRTLPTQATQSSAGPLKVDVITGKYIKVEDDPIISMTFHIENVGSGIVADDTGDSSKDYLVDVEIELPSQMSVDKCSGDFSGTSGKVKLWKGDDYDITCDVRISRAPDISVDATIMVKLEYEYYVDRTTSITVKGRETSRAF